MKYEVLDDDGHLYDNSDVTSQRRGTNKIVQRPSHRKHVTLCSVDLPLSQWANECLLIDFIWTDECLSHRIIVYTYF